MYIVYVMEEGNQNVLFVICGCCRTFVDCFDTVYEHVISKMFDKSTIYVYLYLKLADKVYANIEKDKLVDKIRLFSEKYSDLRIEHKILDHEEISEHGAWSQVKTRHLYSGFFDVDEHLERAVRCHYTFDRCGKYILQKEDALEKKFEYIVYVRPDLMFAEDCLRIDKYNKSLVTLGDYDGSFRNDHVAIVPREHMERFFFDRIKVYRENVTETFTMAEDVYWHTIRPYEVKSIGKYSIKRH